MSNSVEPTPSAEQVREQIRGENESIRRVVEFIRWGMRAGQISAENGEVLTDAAEKQHAAKLHPGGSGATAVPRGCRRRRREARRAAVTRWRSLRPRRWCE